MKAYDYAFSVDGGSIRGITTADTVIGTRFIIGGRYDQIGFSGTIKKLAYYPQRLTDAQLQNLTK
jgi:hypothetical protein